MFLRTADMLSEQTHTYWKLSSIINGKSKEQITVGKAIELVNSLEEGLGPHRALRPCVHRLGDALVTGKSRKKKTSTGSILQLVKTGA